MGLLDGKKGLILNIANDRSIAWHIANNAIKHGATCGFGFLPMEKMERRVRKAMEEAASPMNGFTPAMSAGRVIEKFFAAAREQLGTIDFLVHCLAFADRTYLKTDAGVFTPPRGCRSSRPRHQCLQPDRPHPGRCPPDARWRIGHRPDLSRQRKGHPRLQRDGRRQGRPRIHRPLPGLRPGRQKSASTPSLPARSKPSAPGVGGIDEMFAHMAKRPRSTGTSTATKSASPPSTSSATSPAA